MMSNDFMTPITRDVIKGMTWGDDNLSRTQLAILKLLPPNYRITGTLRLNNMDTQVVSLEHVQKQIQKAAQEHNGKLWDNYARALVEASFASKYLEVNGPVDPSFDLSAIRDPLAEAASVPKQIAGRPGIAQRQSSLSQAMRNDRRVGGVHQLMGISNEEFARTLQAVRDQVEADFAAGRGRSRSECLAMLRGSVPKSVKRILAAEYQQM